MCSVLALSNLDCVTNGTGLQKFSVDMILLIAHLYVCRETKCTLEDS